MGCINRNKNDFKSNEKKNYESNNNHSQYLSKKSKWNQWHGMNFILKWYGIIICSFKCICLLRCISIVIGIFTKRHSRSSEILVKKYSTLLLLLSFESFCYIFYVFSEFDYGMLFDSVNIFAQRIIKKENNVFYV